LSFAVFYSLVVSIIKLIIVNRGCKYSSSIYIIYVLTVDVDYDHCLKTFYRFFGRRSLMFWEAELKALEGGAYLGSVVSREF
jgi:hypothetical protein